MLSKRCRKRLSGQKKSMENSWPGRVVGQGWTVLYLVKAWAIGHCGVAYREEGKWSWSGGGSDGVGKRKFFGGIQGAPGACSKSCALANAEPITTKVTPNMLRRLRRFWASNPLMDFTFTALTAKLTQALGSRRCCVNDLRVGLYIWINVCCKQMAPRRTLAVLIPRHFPVSCTLVSQ